MQILALLSFEGSIIFAYTLIGAISLVAYLPQILMLFKSKGGSKDVSLQTWGVWSLNGLVSLLYAVYILEDLIASLIFAVDFLGAILILGLAASNRLRSEGYISIGSRRMAHVSRFLGK